MNRFLVKFRGLAFALPAGLFAASAQAALPETPISLADASGKTPPTVKPMSPCPFLSDKTALAGVRSRHKIVLSRVSNTRCVWKKNAGFALTVQIEPLAGARPFAERHYNSDGKTQVDSLAGPGKDAVLLSHTTWGKPIAYALGFKLNDKAVFIKATGLKTTGDRLQPLANEIAKQLPGAPAITEQYRETIAAFDNCTIWDKKSFLAALSLPADTAYKTSAGKTFCQFNIGPKGKYGPELGASIEFGSVRKRYWKKMIKKGATALDGYPHPVLFRTFGDQHGNAWSMVADINGTQASISMTDRSGVDRSAHMKALMKNLLGRLR